MADTLKEFSAHSDKNYTNMTTGVNLVTTSGSEKAVVKTVSFENPNGRNITVREGSATGPLVASSSEKTGSFTGNEILDNSQSLIATTTDTVSVTGLINIGWHEGSYTATAMPSERKETPHYNSPAVSFGEYTGNDIQVQNVGDSTLVPFSDAVGATKWTRDIRGVTWSCTGKDGRFYWTHHTANDHQMTSYGNTNRHSLYRVNGNSSTSFTQIAGNNQAHLVAYDGERYIYYIASGNSYITKYDTDPGGTNGNTSTIQLKAENSTSSNMANVDVDQYAVGSYFRDNYWFINPKSNSSSDGANPRLIDVTTGYTKKIDRITDSGNGISTSNMRRSMGIGKDSAGDYWVLQGHFYEDSDNSSSIFKCTNLGSNPRTTFIPSGQTAKATKTIEVGSLRSARRHAAVDGRTFGNPGGMMIHSPGLDRYMFTMGNRYQYQSNASGNEHLTRYDLDNMSMPGFATSISGTYLAGVYRLTKDDSLADGAFGKISLRTTGILVT